MCYKSKPSKEPDPQNCQRQEPKFKYFFAVYKYFILCEHKLIDITGAESELVTWCHSDYEGHVNIGDCDVDIFDYTRATGSIGNIEASPEVESNAFLSRAGT